MNVAVMWIAADCFIVDNTLLNVRINQSADYQLIVVLFGFNIIPLTMEK